MPLTLIQYISASVGILQAGWNLYKAYKAKLDAATLAKLTDELDQAYLSLKKSLTPKELQDAAKTLSSTHSDILKF